MLPNQPIQKLEVVPLRQAFRHEAMNFSQWLENNIDALTDRLGFQLKVQEREIKVGDFRLDLLCEDEDGNRVIIENQLERTDHDHLGKLLTYLVNLEANTAIWVASESRPEHQRVIDWLNENTSEKIAFYLVKVEAIRIGESPYAPLFTILAQPDELIKEIGAEKKKLDDQAYSGVHLARREFWSQLIEKSKRRTPLFASKTPVTDHWISAGAGKTGVVFSYVIARDRGSIEVYIDVGDVDRNKAIFDLLYSEKQGIEQEFGQPLEWHRLEHRRACRIIKTFFSGNVRTPETWDALQDEMVTGMIKLDNVFRKRLTQIKESV